MAALCHKAGFARRHHNAICTVARFMGIRNHYYVAHCLAMTRKALRQYL